MAHTFFVLRQPNVEDRIVVWDTRTLSVGRAPENDVTLEDDEISRKHAMFEKTDAGVPTVGDYHTGAGTFVDGQRVGQSHRIATGNVITIGKLQIELVEQEEHPAKRGLKLEYASQLKTVGMLPSGADPSSTMLGVADGLPAGGDDFVIEHARADGGDVLAIEDDFGFEEIESGELQLELDDELFLDDAPATPAVAPAAPSAPVPQASTAPPPPAVAASAAPAPPAAAAPPAPAPARAAAPPAAAPVPASPVQAAAPAAAATPQPAAPAQKPAAPQARPAAAPAQPRPAAPAAAPAARPLPPAAQPSRPAQRPPANAPPAASQAPAPAPAAADPNAQSSANLDPVARLRRLKALVEEGLITDEEFQAKRARILDEM